MNLKGNPARVGRYCGSNTYTITPEVVAFYADALDDPSPIYREVAPPLLHHSECYKFVGEWYLKNLFGNLHAQQDCDDRAQPGRSLRSCGGANSSSRRLESCDCRHATSTPRNGQRWSRIGLGRSELLLQRDLVGPLSRITHALSGVSRPPKLGAMASIRT